MSSDRRKSMLMYAVHAGVERSVSDAVRPAFAFAMANALQAAKYADKFDRFDLGHFW